MEHNPCNAIPLPRVSSELSLVPGEFVASLVASISEVKHWALGNAALGGDCLWARRGPETVSRLPLEFGVI